MTYILRTAVWFFCACIYAALPCFSSPATAQADLSKTLTQAMANSGSQPGSYKKVTDISRLGAREVTTTYLKILQDGTRLKRVEREMSRKRITTRTITIINQEGNWSLRQNVAIHSPGISSLLQHYGLMGSLERSPPIDKESGTLTSREAVEKNKPCQVIIRTLSEEQREKASAVASDVARNIAKEAPGKGSAKKMLISVPDMIPIKIEYWIDPQSGTLLSTKYISKKGKVLAEMESDPLDPVPELQAELFQLPESAERLFPADFDAYRKALRKFPAASERKAKL